MAMKQNSIIGFNTQGLKSNFTYVKSLLQKYEIMFLSEHWLLNAEKDILDELARQTHLLVSQ